MTAVLDLVRHGAPAGGRRFRGGTVDDPLTPRGWDQMWAVLPAEPPWTAIASSPMLRCRAFAEAAAVRLGLPWQVEERLREVGFGAWEGRTHAEVEAREPAAYRAFYADPVRARPPGAEPLDRFMARVGAALGDLARDHAGGHLLVVAHAGVIRAAVVHALGAPPGAMYRLAVPHAAVTRLEQGGGRWQVRFVNAGGAAPPATG